MEKTIFTIVLTIACLMLTTGCGSSKVNVQDYISVEFTPAYNGYADANLVIDEEGLDFAMDKEKLRELMLEAMDIAMDDESLEEEYRDYLVKAIEENPDMLPSFTDMFNIYLDGASENLSNGDEVVVKIELKESVAEDFGISENKFMKKIGVKLSKDTLKFKVKDLEEASEIKLDLDKLINIDFGKYDGYGIPTAEINEKYLEETIVEEFAEIYSEEFTGHVRNIIAEEYNMWFDVKFDKAYSNLSNGDKVKVNITLCDDLADEGISMKDFESGLNIDLGGASKTFVVTGLAEPKNVIDIFEDLESFITYEGGNGHGLVKEINVPKDYSKQIGDLYFVKGNYKNSFKVLYNNRSIGEVCYYYNNFDDSYRPQYLKKGDVIKITTNVSNVDFEQFGYVVPADTAYVTVPDIGEYLTSKEQITPEVVEALKAKIIDKRSPDEISRIYYAKYKAGVECEHYSTSFIVPVVYVSGWFSGKYYVDDVYDVVIHPDGTVSTEYYNGVWNSYSSPELAHEALDTENFTFELIYDSSNVFGEAA